MNASTSRPSAVAIRSSAPSMLSARRFAESLFADSLFADSLFADNLFADNLFADSLLLMTTDDVVSPSDGDSSSSMHATNELIANVSPRRMRIEFQHCASEKT